MNFLNCESPSWVRNDIRVSNLGADANPLIVMGLAMINGLLSRIGLETVLLSRQMPLPLALKTALGVSLVSMLAMELAMNITDYLLVDAAALTWWSIIPSLLAGFITPWPYNYW